MAKKKRRNRPSVALEAHKGLAVAGTTLGAVLVVVVLVLLGAYSRSQETGAVVEGPDGEGGSEENVEGGIETGVTEEGFPYQGSPDAPVKLIEYSDYLCGHCKDFALETEPRIVEEYVATGKVQHIYHYFVLSQPLLDEAAHCAADQEHFWEYHRVMFAGQSRFGDISTMEELQALLVEFAQQVGLDVPEFEACWTSHRHQQAILEATQEGIDQGISGTPTFSVQGELMVGNQPYENFQKAIEASLEAVTER
jgi:protein-disulfide isomerase